MAARTLNKGRRSNLRFVVLGLALAVVGSAVAFLSVGPGRAGIGAPGAADRRAVVVAARDIPIRTTISTRDLAVVTYAAADLPPGALTRTKDALNLIAAADIIKGQPLVSNLLVEEIGLAVGPQSAYLAIPTGFVALALPTGEQQGVAGYIQAGDYIALLALVPAASGQNVRTVFSNVHVLKVGPASSGPVGSQSPSPTGGVVSSLIVLVTPCQAEYISWFLVNASIRYALESSLDYAPQDGRPDQSCPSVTAAPGVKEADVDARWPGIAAGTPTTPASPTAPQPARPGSATTQPNQDPSCAYRDTRPYGCP